MQLSATSEEVSASSTEGQNITKQAVDSMEKFEGVLNNIAQSALELNQYNMDEVI